MIDYNELTRLRNVCRKEGKKVEMGVYNLILSDCDKILADTGEVTKEQVMKVLRKLHKSCVETNSKMPEDDHRKAELEQEIAILDKYIPQALSKEDIKIVLNGHDFSSYGNRGQAIGAAMKLFQGQEVDKGMIARLVGEMF